jgi:hypothetical protein
VFLTAIPRFVSFIIPPLGETAMTSVFILSGDSLGTF